MPVSSYPAAFDTDATLFKVDNVVEKTLTATLTAGAVTAAVNSTSGVKDQGYVKFTKIVGGVVTQTEFASYTGKTSTTLTGLVRGINARFPALGFAIGDLVSIDVVAELLNDLTDAVKTLQTVGGINPQGVAASVAARILAAEAATTAEAATRGAADTAETNARIAADAAHVAAADPHPAYLTEAEGIALIDAQGAGGALGAIYAVRDANAANRIVLCTGKAESGHIGAYSRGGLAASHAVISANAGRIGAWLADPATEPWVDVQLAFGVVVGDSLICHNGDSPTTVYGRFNKIVSGSAVAVDLNMAYVPGNPAYEMAKKTGIYWYNNGSPGAHWQRLQDMLDRDVFGLDDQPVYPPVDALNDDYGEYAAYAPPTVGYTRLGRSIPRKADFILLSVGGNDAINVNVPAASSVNPGVPESGTLVTVDTMVDGIMDGIVKPAIEAGVGVLFQNISAIGIAPHPFPTPTVDKYGVSYPGGVSMDYYGTNKLVPANAALAEKVPAVGGIYMDYYTFSRNGLADSSIDAAWTGDSFVHPFAAAYQAWLSYAHAKYMASVPMHSKFLQFDSPIDPREPVVGYARPRSIRIEVGSQSIIYDLPDEDHVVIPFSGNHESDVARITILSTWSALATSTGWSRISHVLGTGSKATVDATTAGAGAEAIVAAVHGPLAVRTLTDASGHVNGTIRGNTPTFGSSFVGAAFQQAISWNGRNYIEAGATDLLNPTTPFTLEAFITKPVFPDDNTGLAGFGIYTKDEQYLAILFQRPDGTGGAVKAIGLAKKSDGTVVYTISGGHLAVNFEDGLSHHIALTWDGSNLRLFGSQGGAATGGIIADVKPLASPRAAHDGITPFAFPVLPNFQFGVGGKWAPIIADEVRLSSIVRYTDTVPTYTVPSTQFTTDANTRRLFHCNNSDINAGFSMPSGVWTTVPWAEEDIDTDGAFSPSTPGFFEIPVAGNYRITASATFVDGTTGRRGIRITANGYKEIAATIIGAPSAGVDTDGDHLTLEAEGVAYFDVGDRVLAEVFHTQGAALGLFGGKFSMVSV